MRGASRVRGKSSGGTPPTYLRLLVPQNMPITHEPRPVRRPPRLPAHRARCSARDGPHTSHTHTGHRGTRGGYVPGKLSPVSARRRPGSTAADLASTRLAQTGCPRWRSTPLRWTLELLASRRSRRHRRHRRRRPLPLAALAARSVAVAAVAVAPTCLQKAGGGVISGTRVWVCQVCLGRCAWGPPLACPSVHTLGSPLFTPSARPLWLASSSSLG